MDAEHEELEQIPWSMLAEDLENGRPRWLAQAAVGLVVALVVGFVALQVTRGPRGTVVDVAVTAAATPDSTALAPAAPAAPPETVAAPTGDAAATPSLYSEADLMAVIPEEHSVLAAARAEWFVVDYFGATNAGVPGLPQGLPQPEVGDGYSWVEWAKAIDSTRRPAGGYDVTVAFRTLTGSDDAGYQRLPVRAVIVPVAVDGEGNAAIADLPSPARVPEAVATVASQTGTEVPSTVAESAAAQAAEFGSDPAVLGGSAEGTQWRVVVSVTDRSGIRWPLVVHVPA